MTTPKAVFIDFDGTLADRGVVPVAHAEAIQQARANGHRILLCTGRAKSMLAPEVLDIGFDGLVCSAGGYVEIDDRVLRDTRFPADLADAAVATLDAADVAYVLEAPEAVYGRTGILERMRELFAQRPTPQRDPSTGASPILANLRVADDLRGCSFAKITVSDSDEPVSELANRIGPGVGVLPSSIAELQDRAGEIYLSGVDKASGIEVVIEHFGIEQSDVVAIGDGHNDLEMLEFAGVAIAIAGAPTQLLDLADMVISGPAGEGIVAAFSDLGLTLARVH